MLFMDAVASSALYSLLLVYFAEFWELTALWNRTSAPSVQHLTLLFHLIHNSLNLFHAFVSENWSVYLIHFVGVVLRFAFVVTYLRFSIYRSRYAFQLVCVIIFLLAFCFYANSLENDVSKATLWTASLTAAGVAFASYPTLTVWRSFRTGAVEAVSIWMTASVLLSASATFLYGFLVKDNAMQIAFMPCLALCLIAMGHVWRMEKKRIDQIKKILEENKRENVVNETEKEETVEENEANNEEQSSKTK